MSSTDPTRQRPPSGGVADCYPFGDPADPNVWLEFGGRIIVGRSRAREAPRVRYPLGDPADPNVDEGPIGTQ